MPNTVVLKGRGIRKEAKAGSAITPGMFVALNSSGVLIPSTAGGGIAPNVAVENEVLGWDLNHDYVTNENVLYESVTSGQEIYALLAASVVAAVGGPLKLTTAGTVTPATLPTDLGL